MPSDPTFAYPPLKHHSSTAIDPNAAAPLLASYLEKSLTRPYLHPDAWLSLEGVRHGPKSGPQGSWALHHLRRIEAGMRGESLAVESTEELIERFGEDIVGQATGVRRQMSHKELEEGEAEVRGGVEEEDAPAKVKKAKPAEKPEHEMTKAEKKKARRAAEKAEIARAREKGEAVPSFGKKRKRGSEIAGQSEVSESTLQPSKTADINDPSQYTSAQKYAEEQEEEVAEVGHRDPAGVDREDAVNAPVVVKHDAEGEVVVPEKSEGKKRKGGAGEEAGKATKKAKRMERKGKKKDENVKSEDADVKMEDLDVQMEDSDVKMEDVDPATPATVKKSRKVKRALQEEVNGSTPVVNETNGTPAAGERKSGKKDVAAPPQTSGAHAAGEDKKATKKKAKKSRAEKSS